MLLLKQLRYLNLNGVRKLNVVMHQITNPHRITSISAQSLSRVEQLEPKSVSNAMCFNPPNLVLTRSYYRNYKYHPSKIVRAYRKTRTWLTDHFVVGDRRFENLYSFLFMVTFAIFGILSIYLNLQFGGESGADVNRIPKYDDIHEK